MTFNSFEYLLFFVLLLGMGWALIRHTHIRLWLLLLGSYYFYARYNHWLILLILASTQIDYVCGILLDKASGPGRRKLWLWISVVSNLSILGVFKYFNFFAESLVDLAGLVGYRLSWTDLNILLPVGISFYTFQSLSYTIDVYRGHIRPEKSWIRFSLYIAYFPQLVAGPIVRAADFLPLLRKAPSLDRHGLESGLYLLFRGLFKKVVLADFLMIYADRVFGAEDISTWGLWLKSPDTLAEMTRSDSLVTLIGIYAFAFQIYFDFSGYTDVARGSARLMGYELPVNFNRPYLAAGFSDFWKRWHMSLSTWIRDYVYIPLGGSRQGQGRTALNLMMTMLLAGLWHGAAWTYVIWGGLHGLLLILEHLVGSIGAGRVIRPRGSWYKWLKVFITFNAVCLLWIVFRCQSIGDVWTILGRLHPFSISAPMSNGMICAIIIMVGGFAAQAIAEKDSYRNPMVKIPVIAKSAVYAAILMLMTVASGAGVKPFIYFQF